MNHKLHAIRAFICLLLLSWSPFSAASSLLGIYAGVAVGQAEIKNSDPVLDSSTAKVYAGYRILGPIAVEVASVDLGEYGTLPTKVSGTSADVVLFLPAGPINVFAKAGVFSWDVDYNGALPADSGVDAKSGFGVEYNMLLNLDLRLEWERYTGVGGSTLNSDIDMLSLGINIAF